MTGLDQSVWVQWCINIWWLQAQRIPAQEPQPSGWNGVSVNFLRRAVGLGGRSNGRSVPCPPLRKGELQGVGPLKISNLPYIPLGKEGTLECMAGDAKV